MTPLLFMLVWLAMTEAPGDDPRPMTVHDLLAVRSISDPQVAPDGRSVVFIVSDVDVEADRSASDLYLVPTAGGAPKRLTTAEGSDSHPRWKPDGSEICFVSTRSGSSQVWIFPMDGGEARPLTDLPIGVAGPKWSPDGRTIAFTAEVYPDLTPEETAERDASKAEKKSSALTYDKLMIRHWSTWDTGKRSHLFVVDVETGQVRDLTPDLTANVPPQPFGGSADYNFTPDGQSLAFAAEPLVDHAWSTNTDIHLVPVDGSAPPKNLTASNPAADISPAFSPEPGRNRLAYLSQTRAGFESDQWMITVVDLDKGTQDTLKLVPEIDRPVGSFAWSPDGSSILATLDDSGQTLLAEFSLKGEEPSVRRIFQGGSLGAPSVTPEGDVVTTYTTADRPAEVAIIPATGAGAMTRLTDLNGPLMAQLDVQPCESFTFEGADGDPVQGWLMRPPGFDPSRTYPVLFLIHGGPQGAWHDSWHPRWNLALFAAPGYAVVAINPRGSTGFGQEFTDQISGDWNGRVYRDLMLGLDHALETYPFLDGDRVAAAGGSYGGYMVNWIAGHSERFRALISHAGVFDLPSMYFTTEELWFPEWEFGGPYWINPDLYMRLSPSNFVTGFSTPTLVIHGALDFRVPDAQGLGMFTALQRQGVPSRLLYYPDEGHWVYRPANRITWWNEIHGWLGTYLQPSTSPAD